MVKNLDIMIKRMDGLKQKLSSYADEESRLYHQLDARVAHLGELSTMHTVEELKYETWSRRRLDRLMVDYLLRKSYNESAKALAKERDMSDLVDIDTFEVMSNIRTALLKGSVAEALAWCTENKKELRRMQARHPLSLLFPCHTNPLSSPTSNSCSAANNTSK